MQTYTQDHHNAEGLKASRMRALAGQVERLQRRLDQLQRLSARWSWIRLAVFVVGLAAAGPAYFLVGPWLAGLLGALAIVLFAAAIYCHQRVEHGIARHRVWLEIKAAQIARASLDWDNIPAPYEQQPRPSHPFEADLDLVGSRSLHRLMDTAVSYEGSQRLRDWLTAPVPDPRQTAERQRLVQELIPLPLFRDKLTLNATLAQGGDKAWRANRLGEWLDRHTSAERFGPWLLLLGGLAAADAALFIANRLGLLAPWWQITFVVYLGLMLFKSQAAGVAWDEAMALQGALRQLRAVFRQLEGFSYPDTPGLRRLCASFLQPDRRPSHYLARLTRVVTALSLRGNPVVYFVINAVVPWDYYFAYRLQQCKLEMAAPAREWMEIWFELEALSSLATGAYLNPDHVFPELVVEEGQRESPAFEVEGLGHPLIPAASRVRNDFSFPELGQVAIITGSNMAGKSVFLKTVAVNLALAYAGGAVCARRLHSLYFRLFTSMAISDSVSDGISYFYAEVKRLSALLSGLETDGALPLLFCIDEIFRGTNNRERLIGSRAYVRALAGKHGVGLIATHDLELARLGDEVPQVVNYHFRDTVVGDRMVFDYVLRPGPSPTTNALRIMRLQGLPVPADEEKGDAASSPSEAAS
ncbi:MAG: MutS family DNA mismatch repair protein [Chloroflexota bacterium]